MAKLLVEICEPGEFTSYPDETIENWDQLRDFCHREAQEKKLIWFNITVNTYEGLRFIGVIEYQNGKLTGAELL